MSADRDEELEALASYATASATQLRRLLPGMQPGIARQVSRIAAQLNACAASLPDRTPDPMTRTTTTDVDTARSARCPICSAGPGCNCTGSQRRQLVRSVHVARLEAARAEASDR